MAEQEMASLCILPLSSPYSLLPRIHFYATTLALLAPLPKGWLFRAALASFTTRTSTLAIDAAVQLASLRKHDPDRALPIEVVVMMEMLGLACLVGVWLLLVSRTASISAARGLIKGWATAVAIGAIISFVATREFAGASPPAECPNGRLISSSDVFGDEQVTLLGTGTVGMKMGGILRLVGIPALIFSSLTLISLPAKGHLPKSSPPEPTLSSTSPDITYSNEFSGTVSKAASAVRWLFICAIPAMAVVMVHRTETYLFGFEVPEGEHLGSVGQWGVWAATGVVLLGTGVNAARESMGGSRVEVVLPK
ncbi:uncharacterized protein DNG_04739 [Cephalotrichum gorgonifer]|uniref:Uncharacterized protein n=1 Tax=Cephalotrichum gorgonifer TaxID=2041049 RepID=A0AAE8MWM6_9PEZI|nr:uncharacterized protein DNG_04739 [Cephalotrichum gorgonifer]